MNPRHRETVQVALEAAESGAMGTAIEALCSIGASLSFGPPARQGWLVEARLALDGTTLVDTSDNALLSASRVIRRALVRCSAAGPDGRYLGLNRPDRD